MLPNRYIQAVLTRDIAEELKHTADVFEQCERALLADERQERSQRMASRFAGIGLTVDG